jgi:hypothetical protein
MSQDPNNVPGGNPGSASSPPPTYTQAPSTIAPIYPYYITVPSMGANGQVIIYTGTTATYILPTEAITAPSEKVKEIGCTCVKCKNFNEFAEPNRDDGTFICFACCHGY